MITRREWQEARDWAWGLVREIGIIVRDEEVAQVEVADLGLGELPITGLQILTLVSTHWVGAKLLILRPNQFFPQHRHPPSASGNYPGKEEVFRGQWGRHVYMYPASQRQAPEGIRHLTAAHTATYGTRSFCARGTNTAVLLTRGTGSRRVRAGPSSGASLRKSPTRRTFFSILRSPARRLFVTKMPIAK